MSASRLSITVCVLAGVVTACVGSATGTKPTKLITPSSLAGIHLRDSRPTVDALIGAGREVKRTSAGDVTVAYPQAGLTVFFGNGLASHHHPGVYWVKTVSPRYRTSSGVGVGSVLAKVRAMPGIACSGIPVESCETRDNNGEPGLQFDVAQSRVTAVWLVVRSN